MKYFSMFSGIGGFELGIQNNQKERRCGQKGILSEQRSRHTCGKPNIRQYTVCVGYSEIDKYAIATYEKHFGGHKNYGDATKINTDELPDFDLLVGGFPCQAFSIAGKRRGFEDTRGTLFFDIARVIKAKQPRLFLLENVKGLLNHDGGETFTTILKTIDELGYDAEWQVLNSKHFGVPQNRERVFIIGHLRGAGGRKVFPIRRDSKQINSTEQKENKSIIPTMLSEHRTELGKQTRKEIRQKEGRDSTLRGLNHKEYRPNNHQLSNCITTGKDNVEKWLLTPNTSYAIDSNYYKGTNYEQYKKKKRRQLVFTPRIRRLTPSECERLQGFPDNWTIGSDTQRYKQCGNAVTVNVIQAIMEVIKCNKCQKEKNP